MTETQKAVLEYRKAVIKELLDQCTQPQIDFFKRIFSHTNPDLSLDEVLDKMPDDKIESAMLLCERTVISNRKKKPA